MKLSFKNFLNKSFSFIKCIGLTKVDDFTWKIKGDLKHPLIFKFDINDTIVYMYCMPKFEIIDKLNIDYSYQDIFHIGKYRYLKFIPIELRIQHSAKTFEEKIQGKKFIKRLKDFFKNLMVLSLINGNDFQYELKTKLEKAGLHIDKISFNVFSNISSLKVIVIDLSSNERFSDHLMARSTFIKFHKFKLNNIFKNWLSFNPKTRDAIVDFYFDEHSETSVKLTLRGESIDDFCITRSNRLEFNW